MNILKNVPTPVWWTLCAAVAGIALYRFVLKPAGAAAAAAVNPTSSGNLAYRAVSAVGDALDNTNQDDSFSPGAALYNLFHPGEDAAITAPVTVTRKSAPVGNPTNNNTGGKAVAP